MIISAKKKNSADASYADARMATAVLSWRLVVESKFSGILSGMIFHDAAYVNIVCVSRPLSDRP